MRKRWQDLKRGQPGRRFQQRYERHRHGRAMKWAMLAGGLLVLLAGIVFLPLPGPGMLIMAAGALLMAQGSRAIAKALDALEVRVRRLWFSSPRRSGSP